MGPAISIEKLSLESKSTSSYEYGLHCEEKVRGHYESLGYDLLFHRLKTPFSEIDLVFSKGELRILVEVKSSADGFWGNIRVGHRQKARLRRAYRYLLSSWKLEMEFHLALVDRNGHVEVLKEFLS